MEVGKIETNDSILDKLSHKILKIYHVFKVLLALNVVIMSGLLVLTIVSAFQANNYSELIIDLLIILIYGTIQTVLIYTIVQMLKDFSINRVPFKAVQVKRTKRIAIMFLLFGLADLFVSSSFTVLGILDGVGVASSSANEGNIIKVNLWAYLAAAIFYSLAMILDYASKLQDQSDSFL